jgi:curved DNA-binding protein CbpA
VPRTPLTEAEIQELQQMIEWIDNQQYYRLLNVGRSADAATIQRSYYQQSRKWHPDVFFRRDASEYMPQIDRIFMSLTTAHQTLSDPKLRQQYDRQHPVQAAPSFESTTPEVRRARHRHGRRRRDRDRQRSTSDAPTTTNTNIKETLRQQRRDRVIGQVSSNLEQQRAQALTHFQQGQQDYAAGRVMQAATAMHLACKLDPDNEDFKQHFQMVRKEARVLKAQEYIASAENAESFSNWGRAIELYRKAVAYECEPAAPYARLAYLVSKIDPDPREVIRLLQIAVQKDPDNPEYHCLLGEAYFRQDMALNAKREFEAALKIQKNYERAIEGLSVL